MEKKTIPENLKLSFYNINLPAPDGSPNQIILSTRTSKVMVMSNLCWEYILDERFSEIPEKTLRQLLNNNLLVPSEEDELLQITTKNKEAIDFNDKNSLYEVIQPSANCQLGCYYCGQSHTKNVLTQESMNKIIERIEKKILANKFSSLYIGWFGAEPLMGLQQIRYITKRLMDITKKNNMTYGAKVVTNGLSLKENIFNELTQVLGVNHIEVTLDGTDEYHDKHRYTKENKESFNLIFTNLLTILNQNAFDKKACNVSIRCNVDENNVDGVAPLIDLFNKHELQKKISHLYPIGVYSWGGNDAHKKSITKEEFAFMEMAWIAKLVELKFPTSLVPGRTSQVCMSVSNVSEMYDALGNVFDCTEVSYSKAYEGSSYYLDNVLNDNQEQGKRNFTGWNEEIYSGVLPCSTCKMLPVCGGACPKSWHEDMRACPTNKFNIKDKLKLQYILAKGSDEQKEGIISSLKERTLVLV